MNEVYDIYINQNSTGTNANIKDGKGVNALYIQGIRNAHEGTLDIDAEAN